MLTMKGRGCRKCGGTEGDYDGQRIVTASQDLIIAKAQGMCFRLWFARFA